MVFRASWPDQQIIRATLGTIPFAYLGAIYGGPIGVGLGVALGMLIFGAAALVACYRVIADLARNDTAAVATPADDTAGQTISGQTAS